MNYIFKTIKKVGGVKDKFIRVFETNKIKFKQTRKPIMSLVVEENQGD